MMRLSLLAAIVLSLVSMTVPARAASNFETKAITPDQVPAAIVKTHEKRYGKVRTGWRENTWSNTQGAKVTVYVGWFFYQRKAHRAAYTPEGKGYLTIRYLGGERGLPAAVKAKVKAAHPNLRITAAQRYDAFTANMTAYRVELRKGGTRTITWVNKQGDPITKDNLPDAIEELGS